MKRLKKQPYGGGFIPRLYGGNSRERVTTVTQPSHPIKAYLSVCVCVCVWGGGGGLVNRVVCVCVYKTQHDSLTIETLVVCIKDP